MKIKFLLMALALPLGIGDSYGDEKKQMSCPKFRGGKFEEGQKSFKRFQKALSEGIKSNSTSVSKENQERYEFDYKSRVWYIVKEDGDKINNLVGGQSSLTPTFQITPEKSERSGQTKLRCHYRLDVTYDSRFPHLDHHLNFRITTFLEGDGRNIKG